MNTIKLRTKFFLLPLYMDFKYFANGNTLPREKAQLSGLMRLSTTELLALIIGSGTKSANVMEVAEHASSILDESNIEIDAIQDQFQAITGLGKVKAMQISAALELGRRRYAPYVHPIRSPEDAWQCICHYGDRMQEYFFVLCLNGAHELISYELITKGLLNRSLVHPREVFAPAIQKLSAAIILAHNHPSKKLKPSEEDCEVTTRLIESGKILGIEILDHIIFSRTEFLSMRKLGYM